MSTIWFYFETIQPHRMYNQTLLSQRGLKFNNKRWVAAKKMNNNSHQSSNDCIWRRLELDLWICFYFGCCRVQCFHIAHYKQCCSITRSSGIVIAYHDVKSWTHNRIQNDPNSCNTKINDNELEAVGLVRK